MRNTVGRPICQEKRCSEEIRIHQCSRKKRKYVDKMEFQVGWIYHSVNSVCCNMSISLKRKTIHAEGKYEVNSCCQYRCHQQRRPTSEFTDCRKRNRIISLLLLSPPLFSLTSSTRFGITADDSTTVRTTLYIGLKTAHDYKGRIPKALYHHFLLFTTSSSSFQSLYSSITTSRFLCDQLYSHLV